jgi:hypothetical protein
VAKKTIDLRSLARSYTEMGVKVLAGIAQHGTSESARVSAVGMLMERGWGKVAQPVTGENGEGDIRITMRTFVEKI